MPRRYKKRRYKKKPSPSQNWLSNQPLRSSMQASHTYVTYVDVDPGAAGVLGKHVFSANGMYDPDITGVGTQPLGFDQLATLYNKYTVVGSKIEVTMYNTDATYIQVCGVSVLGDTTGFTGAWTQYAEQARSNYKVMGDNLAERPYTLSGKLSTKAYFGKSPMAEDDLAGTILTNPQDQAYFHVWAGPLQGVDTGPVRCVIKITYSAVWHEPAQLASS